MLLVVAAAFTSCRENKNYYYTPTLDLNVQGGTSGQSNSAIGTSSSSEYEVYKGGAYWGEEGPEKHYTPYNEREHDYNYYRGEAE